MLMFDISQKGGYRQDSLAFGAAGINSIVSMELSTQFHGEINCERQKQGTCAAITKVVAVERSRERGCIKEATQLSI